MEVLESIQKRISSANHFSTGEVVYRTIQEAIVQNNILPGTWLSEEQLSNLLSVSRTPIREAMFRLLEGQLIERAGNGRLYVTRLTVKEAKDLYAVRIALEDLVIKEASENMTELDLVNLYSEIERMRLFHNETNTIGVGERGKQFHNVLYSIANNDVTRNVLDSLQPRFDRYRYVSTSVGQKRTSKAIDEHLNIYGALKDRDIDKARQLMREHLENSKQSVVNNLLKGE